MVLYLQRVKASSQQYSLSIHLNTNERSVPNATENAHEDRWALFLTQNIARIHHMDVTIHNGQSSPALAQAFNNPAPLLETCRLALGSGVHITDTLFAHNAPRLLVATLRSSQHFKIKFFTSLQNLSIKVGQECFRGFLTALEASLQLETVMLVGDVKSALMPSRRRRTVILPACALLIVKDMASISAHYLLSIFKLPQSEQIEFHEIQSFENHGAMSTSMATVL